MNMNCTDYISIESIISQLSSTDLNPHNEANVVSNNQRSAAELNELSVDDSISAQQRVNHYINGHDIQKQWLASNVHSIDLSTDLLISQLLHSSSAVYTQWSNTLHIHLLSSLAQLFKHTNNIGIDSVRLIMDFMHYKLCDGISDCNEVNKYVELHVYCWQYIIDHQSTDTVLIDRYVKCIVKLCDIHGGDVQRITGVQLCAAPLQVRNQCITINESYIRHILLLCQDLNANIRASMCIQLVDVLRYGVHMNILVDVVFAELDELLVDEVVAVQQSAITTLIQLCQLHDTILGQRVLKQIQQLCSNAPRKLQSILADQLGHVIQYARVQVESDSNLRSVILKFAQQLLIFDKSSRLQCAKMLPALILVHDTQQYIDVLHIILTRLLNDSSDMVVLTMIKSIHDIIKYIPHTHRSVIYKSMIDAMNKQLTKQAALQQIQSIYANMQSSTEEIEFTQRMLLLHSTMLTTEHYSMIELLARNIKHIILHKHIVIDSATLDVVVSAVLSATSHTTACNRPVLCDLIAAAISQLQPNRRADLMQKLITEYAQSKSCNHRLSFTYLAESITHYMSSAFCKAQFFNHVCVAGIDKVAAVRAAVCTCVITYKLMLVDPDDAAMQSRLNDTVSALQIDKIPYVKHLMQANVSLYHATTRTMLKQAELDADIARQQRENKQQALYDETVMSKRRSVDIESYRRRTVDRSANQNLLASIKNKLHKVAVPVSVKYRDFNKNIPPLSDVTTNQVTSPHISTHSRKTSSKSTLDTGLYSIKSTTSTDMTSSRTKQQQSQLKSNNGKVSPSLNTKLKSTVR